jgi:hypothetical protein
MSTSTESLQCDQCPFQAYNPLHLRNHVYERHEIPAKLKDDDPVLAGMKSAFYYHVENGGCERHKNGGVICIHPTATCTEAELSKTCLLCAVESS